jgi:hypothetical protein
VVMLNLADRSDREFQAESVGRHGGAAAKRSETLFNLISGLTPRLVLDAVNGASKNPALRRGKSFVRRWIATINAPCFSLRACIACSLGLMFIRFPVILY